MEWSLCQKRYLKTFADKYKASTDPYSVRLLKTDMQFNNPQQQFPLMKSCLWLNCHGYHIFLIVE
jgi:hypothetical protein